MVMSKNTKVLKKMSGTDATLMAIGDIIGSGIFSMTGIAIAFAGPGIPITFLIAGVCAMLLNIPMMVLASAVPVTGGDYVYVSRFMNPTLGFLWEWNKVMEMLNLSVLGLASGQYLPSIFPGLSPQMAGVIAVTIVFIPCMFNIKTSATVQNIMVGLILLALGLFIVLGFPRIKNFSVSGMVTTTGFLPILFAVSFVRSSLFGATGLTYIADEIENTRRTLPKAMAISTMSCCILYALIGLVASHVIPWQDMANQPLSVAAKTFMPKGIFNFFVIGGATFGLLTTLLASFLESGRVMHTAAKDGLFPKWFDATNKFGVPHRILIIMYIIALVPSVLNLPLDYVFAVMNAPALLVGLLPILTVLIAPKKLPNRFKNSYFKIPMPVLWVMIILHIGITLFLSGSLFSTLDLKTIIGIIIFYGAGVLYYVFRIRFLKNKKNVDLQKQMSAFPEDWTTDDMPQAAETAEA